MACGSPESCDSLVGSRKLLPLVPAMKNHSMPRNACLEAAIRFVHQWRFGIIVTENLF